MTKRLLGILLVIAGIAAFHLLGSQPETSALWKNEVKAKIFSEPVAVNDHYVFLAGDKGKSEYKLFEIDSQGKQTAESVQMNILPFSPIVIGNMAILGDRGKVVRGFSVPGLHISWESGTIEPFKIPPMKIDNEKFIIQSTSNTLFCLDGFTGKPVWDKTFSDTIINYAADKVIICIHGFDDAKNPNWKATALDPDDGSILWEFNMPLSSDTPLFVQNIGILSSNEGEILLIDQNSGSLLHKHPVKGLKAVQVLDEVLIMLASGGSRVVCMSLMTGNSWSTTMQSGFNGAAKQGDRLMLVDKKNLRCLDVTTGSQIWRRELDDVYNAFPFRKGIFVTHKESFFSRNTFGSYIETESGNSGWMASGLSLFLKPLATNNGDLLLSFDGGFRMMPKPAVPASDNGVTVPSALSDPTAKNINFWQDKSATGTPQVTASESLKSTGTDKSTTPAPDEKTGMTEDDGWLKKD